MQVCIVFVAVGMVSSVSGYSLGSICVESGYFFQSCCYLSAEFLRRASQKLRRKAGENEREVAGLYRDSA